MWFGSTASHMRTGFVLLGCSTALSQSSSASTIVASMLVNAVPVDVKCYASVLLVWSSGTMFSLPASLNWINISVINFLRIIHRIVETRNSVRLVCIGLHRSAHRMKCVSTNTLMRKFARQPKICGITGSEVFHGAWYLNGNFRLNCRYMAFCMHYVLLS